MNFSSQALAYSSEAIDERTSSVEPTSAMRSIKYEIMANEIATIEAKKTSELRHAIKNASRVADDLSNLPDTTLDTALLPLQKNTTDELFISGWKAYQNNRLAKLEKTRIELPQNHSLSAYLELWEHNLHLKNDIDNPTINLHFLDFIDLHQGIYIGERAAADYLTIVGERINPTLFNRLYNRLIWNKSETPLRAWNYFYNYENYSTEEVQNFIAKEKVTGKPLSFLLDKVLYDDLSWYWTAIVLLMQKEQWSDVLTLIESLPEDMLPASKTTLKSILKDPVRWANRYGRFLHERPSRLSIFLVLRLADLDATLAVEIADRVIPRLSKKWQDMINASLSYSLSVKLSPLAITRFEKIHSPLLDNSTLFNASQIQIWAIKAYLRKENWTAVSRLIRELPNDQRMESVWIYWQARAFEVLGRKREAKLLYQSLSNNIDFYGKLACDALGKDYPKMSSASVIPQNGKVRAWGEIPSINRAVDFYRMELYGLGHREWNWAVRDVKNIEMLSLADYALKQHLIHRMINTSLKSGKDSINIQQRFPTPQQNLFNTVCTGQGIPTSWAYGLIRQESRFMLTVSSAVGARGLMQIMPSTARWLAQKLELADYDHSRLTELEMNLILGTSYLRMLESEFDGNLVLATASYNAGTSRVRQWLSNVSQTLPADIFIETIPYYETRDYVKNVMANTHTYGLLLGTKQPTFRDMLGSINQSHIFSESDLP